MPDTDTTVNPSAVAATRSVKPAGDLGGVFVIMQTPFKPSLDIDLEALRRESEFLVECGVHGMVWPAAASELMSLSGGERNEAAATIAEKLGGRLPLVIGVSAPNLRAAASHARHARKLGAAAVLTLPPTDGHPTEPAMLREYLAVIAEEGQLPIILQTSYPGQSSTVRPELVIELALQNPLLRYAKEEQVGFGSLPWRISTYVEGGRNRVRPFAGAGARNLLNELARGLQGTMPGAGFADIQVKIWNLWQSGRRTEARSLFSKMLMMAVLEQSVGYVLQKEALRRRGIFPNAMMRHTRKPLMDAGDLAELDAIMEVLSPYFIESRAGEDRNSVEPPLQRLAADNTKLRAELLSMRAEVRALSGLEGSRP